VAVSKRDYYEVLGIGRGASEQELKSAYRQMALKVHPDRNPDNREAEEQFKEAAEAYSVLSDPRKRAAYDQFGHAGVQGAASSGLDPNAFADFSDILGDFFGFGDLFGRQGGRRRTRAQRGDDLRYDLELSFEDAVRGMSAEIQLPRQEVCHRCLGKGAEPGDLTTCSACRGRGSRSISRGSSRYGAPARSAAGRGKWPVRPARSAAARVTRRRRRS